MSGKKSWECVITVMALVPDPSLNGASKLAYIGQPRVFHSIECIDIRLADQTYTGVADDGTSSTGLDKVARVVEKKLSVYL